MYNATEDWFSSSATNTGTEKLHIFNVTVTSVEPLKGLLSDATAHLIQAVLEVGVLPELVLAGVTMNIMNMAVFLRQGLSDRINLCLFSLAISDSGYILFLMITRLHSFMRFFDPLLAQYWQLRCLSLIGIYNGFVNTSNCLTLLISLERCLVVISPLKAKSMLPTRTMAVIIVVTFCACFTFLFPHSFMFEVVSSTDPATNATTYKAVFSQMYLDSMDAFEFLINVANVVIQTITFIGVAIATFAIAVRIRAVAAWRQKNANTASSTAERGEASVTRMLFVVCVMYTICNIPSVIRSLVNLIIPDFQPGKRYHNLLFTTMSILHVWASINCSFNFVIYYVMSSRFRDTFHELFKHCKVKRVNVKSSAKSSDYEN